MHRLIIFFIVIGAGLFLFPDSLSSQQFTGFFNFTYDENEDKLLLEIDKLDKEFLYVSSLASGVGSNDLGLDRGKLNRSKVVKFIKAGNKILFIQPNYMFRAGGTTNEDEIKAVEDAFAQSVLWGFKIENEEQGSYFIDLKPFLMQDAANVESILPGNYKLDDTRSALFLPGIKNFPKNSEFETLLTFTGNPSGRLVRSVTPTAGAVTLRQHHSFIELPDENYKLREFDPRAGYFGITYQDYSTPIDQSIIKRFISRHRLEKKNPDSNMSEPVEPIIYYVDRGVPEPIKSALIEGAGWWNQAFEAAGYKNAFFVKEMPEGADMLDVRYNVIQWVHRSTRGWSYGSTVTDPRTGEIIKGHVSLGSLRVRQDFMIAQGLLSPYGDDTTEVERAKEMALARIRQLSAHEVGHTLGLSHAYSSSSEGRTSVMDYPHPLVQLKNGKINLSEAYDDKIGKWDIISIRYGYQDFPKGTNEKEALNAILKTGFDEGMSFLSDATAAGGVHPYTNQWDNAAKPHTELKRVMEIRKTALDNFGENTIPAGDPYATLENVLVPVYFFHRYQIEAAAKIVGGLNYRYAVKGDGQFITQLIPPEEQEEALGVLLEVVSPEALAIPEKLLEMIPPQPMGYSRSTSENIITKTGVTFDPFSAAAAVNNMVFGRLTDSRRAQRLFEYHNRDANQPGLEMILNRMLDATWRSKKQTGYPGALSMVADNSLLMHLLNLASNKETSDEVKAIAWIKIQDLNQYAAQEYINSSDSEIKAHYGYAIHQIKQFMENPEKFRQPDKILPPQGPPIGME